MVEYYGEGDSKTGCFVDTSLPKDRVFLHGKCHLYTNKISTCRVASCMRKLTVFQILLLDCHNNTFLALRTISEMENSTFTLFYKNGINIVHLVYLNLLNMC